MTKVLVASCEMAVWWAREVAWVVGEELALVVVIATGRSVSRSPPKTSDLIHSHFHLVADYGRHLQLEEP